MTANGLCQKPGRSHGNGVVLPCKSAPHLGTRKGQLVAGQLLDGCRTPSWVIRIRAYASFLDESVTLLRFRFHAARNTRCFRRRRNVQLARLGKLPTLMAPGLYVCTCNTTVLPACGTVGNPHTPDAIEPATGYRIYGRENAERAFASQS